MVSNLKSVNRNLKKVRRRDRNGHMRTVYIKKTSRKSSMGKKRNLKAVNRSGLRAVRRRDRNGHMRTVYVKKTIRRQKFGGDFLGFKERKKMRENLQRAAGPSPKSARDEEEVQRVHESFKAATGLMEFPSPPGEPKSLSRFLPKGSLLHAGAKDIGRALDKVRDKYNEHLDKVTRDLDAGEEEDPLKAQFGQDWKIIKAGRRKMTQKQKIAEIKRKVREAKLKKKYSPSASEKCKLHRLRSQKRLPVNLLRNFL